MNPASAALFSEHRPHLLSVAYRMLGSWSEAEDAVQDAFLRLEQRGPEALEAPRAWLTTVVTRLCLDRLGSARARRETYPGVWLPEPVLTDEVGAPLGPAHPADADSLSLAFLAVLERLSPLERAAFLLHDVFDYDHAEVAAVLERDPTAVRQLVHRARSHVRGTRPRFPVDRDRHLSLLSGFLAAAAGGDLAALEAMLSEDAVLRSDGGGRARAALREMHGARRVARLVLAITRRAPAGLRYDVLEVNGAPALVWSDGGRVTGVLSLEADGDRVRAIHLVVNPDKLVHVHLPGVAS